MNQLATTGLCNHPTQAAVAAMYSYPGGRTARLFEAPIRENKQAAPPSGKTNTTEPVVERP